MDKESNRFPIETDVIISLIQLQQIRLPLLVK